MLNSSSFIVLPKFSIVYWAGKEIRYLKASVRLRRFYYCCLSQKDEAVYSAYDYWLHGSETADVGCYVVWCLSGGFVTQNSWKVTVIWSFTLCRSWGVQSIKALVRTDWMPTQMHQVSVVLLLFSDQSMLCWFSLLGINFLVFLHVVSWFFLFVYFVTWLWFM